MEVTSGRMNFLSRVASNSLDIIDRELRLGPLAREAERNRLRALLAQEDGEVSELRWALTHALRSGALGLEAVGLADHLRSTVVDQLEIDQPRYAGLSQAIENAAMNPERRDERRPGRPAD